MLSLSLNNLSGISVHASKNTRSWLTLTKLRLQVALGVLQLMQKVPGRLEKIKYFFRALRTASEFIYLLKGKNKLASGANRANRAFSRVRIVCESHIGTAHGVHERAARA